MREDFILAMTIAMPFYMVWSSWQFACIREKLNSIEKDIKKLNK